MPCRTTTERANGTELRNWINISTFACEMQKGENLIRLFHAAWISGIELDLCFGGIHRKAFVQSHKSSLNITLQARFQQQMLTLGSNKISLVIFLPLGFVSLNCVKFNLTT